MRDKITPGREIMVTWNTKVLFAIIALTLLPLGAQAQGMDESDISVFATVLEALTADPVNDLSFGNVIQGQSSTVSPEDPEAGRFIISGEATSEVNLTFTLPSVLDLGSGLETMDISFSATSARHNTADDASAGTAFDPNTGAITPLNPTNGELYVYIGGMVQSTISQLPGDYEGTITLTVEYTGN